MASTLKGFDSTGGLSVDTTIVVDQDKNFKNINSLEIKNSFFDQARTTNYVLTGQDTSILAINNVLGSIILRENSLNFINTHVAAVNSTGVGVLTMKLESAVSCDNLGAVSELSTMRTTIREGVPTGENWDINLYTGGAAFNFSYTTTKAGTGAVVKWFASVQVVSIDWT
jgi:hypothetical protein